MREYLSEAVVLRLEPQGVQDGRAYLFTKKFGKLTARVKSLRKITSKLAGHLQVGHTARVRLIEKRGLQLTDALKTGRVGAPPPALLVLEKILAEAGPDKEVWQILQAEQFSWLRMLRVLGWDPTRAVCGICRRPPQAFDLSRSEEHTSEL